MGNGFAFYYTFLKYLIMHYFYIKIFTTLAGTHFRRSEQILLFSALADVVAWMLPRRSPAADTIAVCYFINGVVTVSLSRSVALLHSTS